MRIYISVLLYMNTTENSLNINVEKFSVCKAYMRIDIVTISINSMKPKTFYFMTVLQCHVLNDMVFFQIKM